LGEGGGAGRVDEGWRMGMGRGRGVGLGAVEVLVVGFAFLARDLALRFWSWRETKDQKRAASEGGEGRVWGGAGAVGRVLVVGSGLLRLRLVGWL